MASEDNVPGTVMFIFAKNMRRSVQLFLLSFLVLAIAGAGAAQRSTAPSASYRLTSEDEAFLDDLSRRDAVDDGAFQAVNPRHSGQSIAQGKSTVRRVGAPVRRKVATRGVLRA